MDELLTDELETAALDDTASLEELIAAELTASDELLSLELISVDVLALLKVVVLELLGVGSATQAANKSAGSASVARPSVFNIVMLPPSVLCNF